MQPIKFWGDADSATDWQSVPSTSAEIRQPFNEAEEMVSVGGNVPAASPVAGEPQVVALGNVSCWREC